MHHHHHRHRRTLAHAALPRPPAHAALATLAAFASILAFLAPATTTALPLAEYAKTHTPKVYIAADVKDPAGAPLHKQDQTNNLKKGEPIITLSGLGLTDIEGISTLKVEHKGKRVPITSLPRLHLYINDNNLTTIPAETSRLKNVLYIYLKKNALTEIPPCMIELESLEGMYFTNNKITHLPPHLFTFKQLRKLEVTNNRLTVLPPEIGNLRNLIHLRLDGNRLTALPDTISKLVHLRVCDFSNNDLRSIPQTWADDCRVLYHLRLNGNKNLKEFPIGKGFETMTAALQLNDTGIDMEKLPPKIRARAKAARPSGASKPKPVYYKE
jgi:Leucine-rich repeat (LRR) protein